MKLPGRGADDPEGIAGAVAPPTRKRCLPASGPLTGHGGARERKRDIIHEIFTGTLKRNDARREKTPRRVLRYALTGIPTVDRTR